MHTRILRTYPKASIYQEGEKSLGGDTACSKEYFLPGIIDEQIKKGKARVRILETEGQWFGVTYKEDSGSVRKSFELLTESGIYDRNLWSSFHKDYDQ